MKGSVTVHIAAPPDLVWDLVSEVTRIGEYSQRPSPNAALTTRRG
ncbi:MAG TPA: hypothetical protein VID31_07005 [Streptosporangiaceae bacterium]